jgi:hypothetical protein
MGSLLAKVAQKYKIIMYKPKIWNKHTGFKKQPVKIFGSDVRSCPAN